jgi:hypothetical protein
VSLYERSARPARGVTQRDDPGDAGDAAARTSGGGDADGGWAPAARFAAMLLPPPRSRPGSSERPAMFPLPLSFDGCVAITVSCARRRRALCCGNAATDALFVDEGVACCRWRALVAKSGAESSRTRFSSSRFIK